MNDVPSYGAESTGTGAPEDSDMSEVCREALERVYYDWWAENDHALSLGAPGDVADLRFRLNAAFAKSCKSS